MAEQLTRGDPLSGPTTLDVGVRVTGFRAVTVVAAGEIDTLGAPVVEAALSRVWTQGSRRVTVDLTAVTFLNGAGLRVLARARSTARRRRAALTLRAGDRWVYRLLELVDLRNDTVGPPAPVEPDSGGRLRTPGALLRPAGPQPIARGTADALSGASVASGNVRGGTRRRRMPRGWSEESLWTNESPGWSAPTVGSGPRSVGPTGVPSSSIAREVADFPRPRWP